ncbi:MAG TPA: proton-conducting transporter membrane subunit [Vicinamibacterales bacterium]|nr:proton-conducting transporter membrane subunit [Vicinamibacterales bacterium]
MRHLLSLTVLAPALGAIAIAVAGSNSRRARVPALVSTTVAMVCALLMWVRFVPRGDEWQFLREIDLSAAIPLRYAVGVDGLSLTLILVATAIAAASALWVWGRGMDGQGGRMWIALLLVETGVVGALASLDVLQFAIFWLLAMLAASTSIRDPGEGRSARAAIALSVLAGATLVLVLVVLHVRYRALAGYGTFDLRALATAALAPSPQRWLFAALLLPLALPLGLTFVQLRALRVDEPMDAGRVVALVFLSTLLCQTGTYLLVRFGMTVLPDAVRTFSPFLIGACALGAVAAAVAAIAQTDIARLAVFAGVSQYTLALFRAFALTPEAITGAVVQQAVQAMSTAALLFAAAAVAERFGTRSIAGIRAAAGGGSIVSASTIAGARERLAFAAFVLVVAGIGIWPAPLLARLETSVARVVLRVSPEYAPQVADCLSRPPKPPDPAETGLPAGMVIAAPCATDQSGTHDAKK